jgi:hypothetical protein
LGLNTAVNDTDDETCEPANAPDVTVPVTDAFVPPVPVNVAEKFDGATFGFVVDFHLIVPEPLAELPGVANVTHDALAGVVITIETLPDVTEPPTQPRTLPLAEMVCGPTAVFCNPGEIFAFPLPLEQLVPPAALAGTADKAATGTASTAASPNTRIVRNMFPP